MIIDRATVVDIATLLECVSSHLVTASECSFELTAGNDEQILRLVEALEEANQRVGRLEDIVRCVLEENRPGRSVLQ